MVQSNFGGKKNQDLVLAWFSQDPSPLCSLPNKAARDSGNLLKVVSTFPTAKTSHCFGLEQVQVISKDETMSMKIQRNWAQVWKRLDQSVVLYLYWFCVARFW